MKKVISFIFLLFVTSNFVASAHQPRMVDEETYIIENPEISQAYYGELTGKPQIFKIEEDKDFKLYVQILSPDIKDADKDFSVEITKGDKSDFYYLLDGTTYKWGEYYEEFAGDNYFTGPELKDETVESELPVGIKVPAGKYKLKVFSPDNKGQYTLAVGEKEEFPPLEIVKTIFVVPQIKLSFGKTIFEVLTSPTMLIVITSFIVIVVFLVYLIKFIIKKYFKNDHK